ncbi:hypothetical protein BJV74DRAFT_837004 [Russula compacta]|nr:hypothetical protein BJV74DRAFT_837004 [Russula compacta]
MYAASRHVQILVNLTPLQDIVFADLFHLPLGSVILEQLQLGGLEKRPNVQRAQDV